MFILTALICTKKTEIRSDQLILNATFTLLMHLESAFQISYTKQGLNPKGIHATSIGLPHKPHIKNYISKNKQIHPQHGMQHISHGNFPQRQMLSNKKGKKSKENPNKWQLQVK